MTELLDSPRGEPSAALVELGIQHEQQHQELLLMDIKHVLSRNPLLPAYDAVRMPKPTAAPAATWTEYPAGMHEIGYAGRGFCFDNELPRHRTYLGGFAIADQTVTCGEWLAFIEDGGYRPTRAVAVGRMGHRAGGELGVTAVLVPGRRWLAGVHPRRSDPGQSGPAGLPPQLLRGRRLCPLGRHATPDRGRMGGGRAPAVPVQGHFLDQTKLHPIPVAASTGEPTLFGNVWQWTSSAYSPYPGFEPAPGAVGEYNGKFMVNQYVLRGGSCVTPPDHIRASYRNFFPPSSRWAFTGLRLARTC